MRKAPYDPPKLACRECAADVLAGRFLGALDVGQAEPPAQLVEPRPVRLRDAPEPIVQVMGRGRLVLARPLRR